MRDFPGAAYDAWKTTDPADAELGPEPVQCGCCGKWDDCECGEIDLPYSGSEPPELAQCDCCGKMVHPDQIHHFDADRCSAGIETFACEECCK